MILEQKKQFMQHFFTRAQAGEIATTAEIHQAFEAGVARKVDESTIYCLLERHGWRKLMPRPRHPQASEEAQHQLKKNFQRRFKRQLKQKEQKTTGRC